MKKILVVRFKQIGDAILSSVICSALKEIYPDSQIDYVLYDYVAPLFEKQPHIDNVIVITNEERENIFKYLKKVWEVTRNDYDIVIDVMSTLYSEAFTLFSPKAQFKIGREKKKRGYTYTHRIPEPPDTFDKKEKFLEMLRPLEKAGIKVNFNTNYYLRIPKNEKMELRNRMEEAGVDFNKMVFAFAINSRREHKIYPVDLMEEVIKMTLDKYDCQIIFYYSPEEEAFAKDFHKRMNEDRRMFTNIKTKSIRELGALLSNCDGFFGNEGGPRHLAEALDIPSFAIFSPGSNKNDWLSRNRDRHKGIEFRELGIELEKTKHMSYEERYRAIRPEKVFQGIEETVDKYIKNKK